MKNAKDIREVLNAVKEIRACTMLSKTEALEVCRRIVDGDTDFEEHGYRFIDAERIDKIQQQELSADPYILGCFNASFLADILGLDSELIKIIQDAEGFEKLGESILNSNVIEELQREYVKADGYGHHFAHYDHEENPLYFGQMSAAFFAFRV